MQADVVLSSPHLMHPDGALVFEAGEDYLQCPVVSRWCHTHSLYFRPQAVSFSVLHVRIKLLKSSTPPFRSSTHCSLGSLE